MLEGDEVLQKAVVLGNPGTNEDPNTVIKLEGIRRVAAMASSRGCSNGRENANSSSRSVAIDAPRSLLRGVNTKGLSNLCESSILKDIAVQLIGDRAELMKDKFIFKPSGTVLCNDSYPS